ncbi:uncharacterized protein [Epargyreus clarus]|uniref:uncharacterized protein n=1 Tax=Epargyreus clarus TaxID=520877 RepID=UPI003C300155
MFRVIVLLAVLGVAHCVVWGWDYSGPDSDDSGPDSGDSGPDSDDSGSGPSNEHDHGFGWWGPDHGHGEGCGHHGVHNQNLTWHSEYDRRFDRLSAYIMRADRFAKEFCNSFTPSDVQELHGNSFYKLTYPMPQLDPKDITVKIKHRVLYMYARQSDSATSPIYVDVRILPDTLKMSDAAWKYEQDHLSIVIPYEPVLRTKIMKTCVEVNADVKDVPKASPLIYKFGEED